MRTSDFDFELPQELIAQAPARERDASRLLVVHRASGLLEHRVFSEIAAYLRAGDVLVLNKSRVIPARLRGVNAHTSGQFELLLLEENSTNDWWVMLRPGKRARAGTKICLRRPGGLVSPVTAAVIDANAEGHRRVRFEGTRNILDELDTLGEVPLPPYIRREGAADAAQDRERYQTVFAEEPGSVAAPTAGLHFTGPLLNRLRAAEVQVCFLTLHVGLGTFAPVKCETLAGHVMHEERYTLGAESAACINAARREGRRVIAVGTTVVRALESAAAKSQGPLQPVSDTTRIFIHPPYRFAVIDALLTNFHLPRSTLLMLAAAFMSPRGTEGRDLLLRAYAEAVRERYRFFSYGDAMLIL